MKPDLSPQAVALLQLAAGSLPETVVPTKPTVRSLVRYLASALPPAEASSVEMAIVHDLGAGELLASTYRTIEDLRKLAWSDLLALQPTDLLGTEIRAEWIDCVQNSLLPAENPTRSLAGILEHARTGFDASRIASGIVAHLKEVGLAPQTTAFAASGRASFNQPNIESPELEGTDFEFDAEIWFDGTLALELRSANATHLDNRTVWIAFEANRQWLCLGSAEFRSGSAILQLPGFGKLVELSAGQLPGGIFALRLDEWPSVCKHGALVVQSGPEPFAEIESIPVIEDGNVQMEIRLIPFSTDLIRSKEIQMWFGTGGSVWQLLGRWPIPREPSAKMSLSCPSPKPGPVGIAFPGVLKLALHA